MYNGTEIARYDEIGTVIEFGDGLAYAAQEQNRTFIVAHGQQLGTEFDVANHPVAVNGSLAYQASNNGTEFVVMDGEPLNRRFDEIGRMKAIDGKLTYIAEDDDDYFGNHTLMYGSREIGTYSSLPLTPIEVDGDLVYAGVKNGQWYLVKER